MLLTRLSQLDVFRLDHIPANQILLDKVLQPYRQLFCVRSDNLQDERLDIQVARILRTIAV